ncbi:integrase [Halopseudomonas bauzanensis]|nr:integrase [Halopseudomonas bauzanensis]
MGQVHHGSATTTAAIRRAIQHSQESLRALAKRYGINQKTVAKWKKRTSVADRPTGPKEPHSTVLSVEEEAIIVALRKHTLLPLDDCLYALQPTIPQLSRSSLHRCLSRHGISRLPEIEGDQPAKKKFKSYPIGCFHIDIAEVQTAEGKLRLFVAIERTSKFAYAELHQEAGKMATARFLRNLIAALPYAIHTVLTENGIQFTNHARHKYAFHHIFDRVCNENGIGHRLTRINHPWTNGQVERMNRTIKDATVKRFHYDKHDQLRRHLNDFIDACNFVRRLKTLKGLTPYEFICKQWTSQPHRSIRDHAFFEQTVFQRQIGNAFLQRAGFAAQILDLVAGGGARRVTGQAALAGFHELPGPGVIQALRDAFLAAQIGDAVFAAQSVQHEPDLVFR